MSALIALPAVKEAGGALMRIMGNQSELVRFANGDLDEDAQFAVIKMVLENPELNTENGIGGLIWLSTFHGEELDKWLLDITAEYPSDDVYLAIEFLYELGKRSKDDTSEERSQGRDAVTALTELLQLYKDIDGRSAISTTEAFDGLVNRLGGLNAALQVDNRFLLEEMLQQYEDDHRE